MNTEGCGFRTQSATVQGSLRMNDLGCGVWLEGVWERVWGVSWVHDGCVGGCMAVVSEVMWMFGL